MSEVATVSPKPFSSFTASIKPTTKPLKKEPQPSRPIVPEFRLPSQEEISTTPLVPYKDDEPLAESLPYTVDDNPDDITAEQEEALLDPEAPEGEKRQYKYASNPTTGMTSCYSLGVDPAQALSVSAIQHDVPEGSGVPPRKKKKASSSSADRPIGHTLLYGPRKPDDEEPPSMV